MQLEFVEGFGPLPGSVEELFAQCLELWPERWVPLGEGLLVGQDSGKNVGLVYKDHFSCPRSRNTGHCPLKKVFMNLFPNNISYNFRVCFDNFRV